MFKLCVIFCSAAIFFTYCACLEESQPRSSFILSEPNEKGSYDQAWRICKAHGNMKPVSILDKEKNREVVRFLASYDVTSAWTSGDDLDVRSKYVWAGVDKPFVYLNWLKSAPLEDESCRCVSIAYGSGGSCENNATKCAGWTVEKCSNLRRVVCEF